MTEAEWWTGADPESMLKLLPGRVSDRKLRLFACACSRRHRVRFPDPDRDWAALLTSEQYADRLATRDQLRYARKRARHGEAAAHGDAWEAAMITVFGTVHQIYCLSGAF